MFVREVNFEEKAFEVPRDKVLAVIGLEAQKLLAVAVWTSVIDVFVQEELCLLAVDIPRDNAPDEALVWAADEAF